MPYKITGRFTLTASCWFLVSDSWFLVSDSLFLVSNSLFLVPHFWFLVPDSLFLISCSCLDDSKPPNFSRVSLLVSRFSRLDSEANAQQSEVPRPLDRFYHFLSSKEDYRWQITDHRFLRLTTLNTNTFLLSDVCYLLSILNHSSPPHPLTSSLPPSPSKP